MIQILRNNNGDNIIYADDRCIGTVLKTEWDIEIRFNDEVYLSELDEIYKKIREYYLKD